MKNYLTQDLRQHTCRLKNGGARLQSMLLLMLLTWMLLPARMAAQTNYDASVTFTFLDGYSYYQPFDGESYENLFDGKKTEGDFSKMCCEFYYYDKVYVIFEASKAGIPVGYTITTSNDSENNPKRNPKSWNLYGNNEGTDGAWTLIQSVTDDNVLEGKNYASYDFICDSKRTYKYFKWEITSTQGSNVLQVGEFELKLNTCTHQKEDGTSALCLVSTTPATCITYGYTTYECSICKSELEIEEQHYASHDLTKTDAVSPTCTTKGNKEYWTCNVCKKIYADEAATTQISSLSDIEEPATGHKHTPDGKCTVCDEIDYRFSAIAMDGITINDIIDEEEQKWKVLDLNDEVMKTIDMPEGSKGLMLTTQKSTKCDILLHSDKPFVLSFRCGISKQNGDYISVLVDGVEFADFSYITQENGYVRVGAGDHTVTLEGNTSRTDNSARVFIYDMKANYSYTGAVAMYDENNKSMTLKYAKNEEVSENMYTINDAPTAMYQTALLRDAFYHLADGIKQITIDESFKNYKPTTLRMFLKHFPELTKIEGLGNINTSQVKRMDEMFQDCTKLEEVDTEKLNTENVENMYNMFYNCKSLKVLDISGFNTAKVKNMSCMFYGCSALERLIVSDIERGNQMDFGGILYSCPATIYCSPKEASKSKRTYESIFNTYYMDNNDRMVPYVSINPKAEYGTLCVPFGCSTLEEGSFSGFDKIYTIESCDVLNSVIKLEEAKSIEPGVAYIYHRNLTATDLVANAITFKADLSDDNIVTAPANDGILKGTFERITAPGGSYILQTDGMFHPVAQNNSTIGVGAYRAYLELPGYDQDGGYAKNFQMVFEDDETTDVKGVYEHTGSMAPTVYYDLMGRRVSSPAKGQVYIVNGKKVRF